MPHAFPVYAAADTSKGGLLDLSIGAGSKPVKPVCDGGSGITTPQDCDCD